LPNLTINAALSRQWDAQTIRMYAEENSWDNQVEVMVNIFNNMPGVRFKLM
jgi:hypothetical protein